MLVSMSFTMANAQNAESLKGQWGTEYELDGEKTFVVYEFRKSDGKLKGYSILLKDGESKVVKDNTLVMHNIKMNKGKGSATYKMDYEGEKYEVKVTLTLKSKKVLNVSYSYSGYTETEVWVKRT